jgi:hypothetical protein
MQRPASSLEGARGESTSTGGRPACSLPTGCRNADWLKNPHALAGRLRPEQTSLCTLGIDGFNRANYTDGADAKAPPCSPPARTGLQFAGLRYCSFSARVTRVTPCVSVVAARLEDTNSLAARHHLSPTVRNNGANPTKPAPRSGAVARSAADLLRTWGIEVILRHHQAG